MARVLFLSQLLWYCQLHQVIPISDQVTATVMSDQFTATVMTRQEAGRGNLSDLLSLNSPQQKQKQLSLQHTDKHTDSLNKY